MGSANGEATIPTGYYGSDHRGRERIRQAAIAPIVHMQLVRIEKLFVAEMPLVPEPHQLEPAEKRRA